MTLIILLIIGFVVWKYLKAKKEADELTEKQNSEALATAELSPEIKAEVTEQLNRTYQIFQKMRNMSEDTSYLLGKAVIIPGLNQETNHFNVGIMWGLPSSPDETRSQLRALVPNEDHSCFEQFISDYAGLESPDDPCRIWYSSDAFTYSDYPDGIDKVALGKEMVRKFLIEYKAANFDKCVFTVLIDIVHED